MKMRIIIVESCRTCPYYSQSALEIGEYHCKKDMWFLNKAKINKIDKRCTIEQIEFEEE